MAEEMIALYREIKELIALLLIIDDKDDARRKNLETLVYTPGSKREEIERLITLHRSVLAKLREQAAKWGELHTPAHIALEIETTERQITELQEKLKGYEKKDR